MFTVYIPFHSVSSFGSGTVFVLHPWWLWRNLTERWYQVNIFKKWMGKKWMNDMDITDTLNLIGCDIIVLTINYSLKCAIDTLLGFPLQQQGNRTTKKLLRSLPFVLSSPHWPRTWSPSPGSPLFETTCTSRWHYREPGRLCYLLVNGWSQVPLAVTKINGTGWGQYQEWSKLPTKGKRKLVLCGRN